MNAVGGEKKEEEKGEEEDVDDVVVLAEMDEREGATAWYNHGRALGCGNSEAVIHTVRGEERTGRSVDGVREIYSVWLTLKMASGGGGVMT